MLKVNGQSSLAGFQAITWHRSTVLTSSAGTMARCHAVPLSTCWAVALMAASWCERVRVVRVRGRCLYDTKVECTTTASTKTQRDRCACWRSSVFLYFLIFSLQWFDRWLLAGWQEGHLPVKKLCQLSPMVLFQNNWMEKMMGTAKSRFSWNSPIEQRY